MRGERDKDLEALMARYGIGRRLATRAVALLSRQVDVTGTILEEAGSREPLARLLLDPDLLEGQEAVTEEYLRSRAAELGFEEAALLRVAESEEGWRTICLEDDLLAEGARPEGAETSEGELSLVRREPGEISTRETQELFGAEEVARLKLDVLTSQNPEERIEALRKLVFAPMEGAQKATIFANVLTDREAGPKLRREAVRSLEQIGFRSDMAEAVRKLFTESPEDTIYAIRRLGALLGEAERGEASLILAVLLEVLEQNRDVEVIDEILGLVAESAGLLVSNYQKTERFVEATLRQLARNFDELRREVEETFEACAAEAPEAIADLLWRELERSENARIRSLLLSMSEEFARTQQRPEELAERAVEALADPDLPESEKAKLRYALVRMGEAAALVVLERIDEAAGVQRSEFTRLLDVVCTESTVSEETLVRSVRVLLDLLKLADTVTRCNVVQTSVLADPAVPSELQQEVSRELLALMTELELPDTLDVIQDTLQRIGQPAVRPAYEFMRNNYPSDPAERAALVLAGIIEKQPDEVEAELLSDIHALCESMLEEESIKRGGWAMTLAAICGHTRWGKDRFEATLAKLREKLWRVPYTMDALDALAVMGGAPNASRPRQEELFELFDAIVRYEAPTGIGVQKETETGTVYKFGRQVQFDIRAVPAAVRGLEAICVSPQASADMRARIVKRLLVLWEGVSKVRIVWGPAAIEALVRAMCSAACSEEATVQMRVRLGASLRRFLNKIRVIQGLGQICSLPELSPDMHDLAVETGNEMLAEWKQADLQDEERRLALLKAAGRIAANEALRADEEKVRKLRERTLQALFSGLRDGMAEVREPLLRLRECADVSPAQKKEIDERLAKVFGLVRSEPSA